MLKNDAARESQLAIAFQVKDDFLLRFFEFLTGQVYTQASNGQVRKIAGKTIKNTSDWVPLEIQSAEHEIWINKGGPLPEPKQPFEAACADSDIGMAWRLTKDGDYMVRNSSRETWIQHNTYFNMLGTAFRKFDNWKPITEDQPFYKLTFSKRGVEFRDPRRPPSCLVGDDLAITMWIEGYNPPAYMVWLDEQRKEREVKKQTEAKIQAIEEKYRKMEKEESIPVEKQQEEPALKICMPNPIPLIDNIAPEILAALLPLTTALTSTIKDMISIGGHAEAKELAMSLKHLVNNAAWGMREDRTRFAMNKVKEQQS